MRRKSPVTVQQWIDSLPISSKTHSSMDKNDCPTTSTPHTSPFRQGFRGMLFRDSSIQSDDASNCSSVESVLELRKPDPEAVLLGLGFGPPKATDYLSRIPKRFLQPSRVCKFIIILILYSHTFYLLTVERNRCWEIYTRTK